MINKHSLCEIDAIIKPIIATYYQLIDLQNCKMLTRSIGNLKNEIKLCLYQKKGRYCHGYFHHFYRENAY